MKAKKNIMFVAGGVAFLLLLLLIGAALVGSFIKKRASDQVLSEKRMEFQSVYATKPFPSGRNGAREKENVKNLRAWFVQLVDLARKGQVEPSERSPSNFMSLLSEKRKQLDGMAKAVGTVLPADFGFGFDRYFASSGALPAPDDVPRLTQQLVVVDKISTVLFDAKVDQIDSIEREEFEGANEAPGENGGSRRVRPEDELRMQAAKNAGVMAPGAWSAKFHLTVKVKAREKSLLAVLDRLAAHEMFVVVTSVGTAKTAPDVKEAAVKKAVAPGGLAVLEPDDTALSRAQRTVSGPVVEVPMDVTIELDVYRFKNVAQEA
jgi:hypothetical protein